MSKTGNKIPNLGKKGSILPRKQKNPRPSKKKDGKLKKGANYMGSPFWKDFVALNAYNVTLSKSIMDGYWKSEDKIYKDSVITYWVRVCKMKERMARNLFGIGYSRYNSTKNGEEKKKPGGRKPNWVSS